MLTFALETNIEEALGFLSFSGIIPWLIFILLITSFYYITKKNNESGKLSKILLILSLIYPLTEYLFFNKYSIPRLYQLRKNPIELLSGAYKRFLLFKEPLNIFRYYNIKTYLKNALNKERTLPNGVTIQNNLKDDTHPKRIVFILGESDTKWHHGIYGYKHPTDPFMQEIIKDVKKSAVFNAIASASSTNLAVPRLMTFSTARDSEPGLENSNVIEMANIVGYTTYWLSKQNEKNDTGDVEIHAIANSAKRVYFNRNGLSISLIPIFEQYFNNREKQFFVLHIYGSHMRYASRHTDSDFQQVISSDEEYRHYDATIVHTDNFLKLLNKYSDMNTLFIYLIMVKSSIKGMDFLALMQEAMKFLSSYGLTIQNLLLDLKKLLPDIL